MPSVHLTDEEIEQYLSEITAGVRPAVISKENGNPVRVLIRNPTAHERRVANSYYKDSFERAKKEGMRTREQIEKEFISYYKLYTEEDKLTEAHLRDQVKVQQKLFKAARSPHYKDLYKSRIENAEQEYYEFVYKKLKYEMHTAEVHADSKRMNYYVFCCILDFYTLDPIWNSYSDFESEKDAIFIRNLREEVRNFFYGISVDVLRALSRTQQWRAIWNVSVKTGAPLFGIPMHGGQNLFSGPVSTWSYSQIQLCSWSIFYDNVLQSAEPPPQFVVDNDELLDKYVDQQVKKQEMERAKNTGTGKSAFDHEDVIVLGEDKQFMFDENGNLAV